MDPILKNLVRVGHVSAVNAARCSARVTFPDKEQVVSHELPVLVRGTAGAKDYWLPVPGEQVLCVFLPNGNARGFILGSFYSDDSSPPAEDAHKRGVTFADGTSIEYDASTHTLAINATGPIRITAPAGVVITGDLTVSGTVSQGGAT